MVQNKSNEESGNILVPATVCLNEVMPGWVPLPRGSDLFGTRDAYCASGKINVDMGTLRTDQLCPVPTV
jgi:hypothetical protein